MQRDASVLITGSNGMLGRNLVELLQATGYTHLLTPSSKELDLTNQDAVYAYMQAHRPKTVLHLAAKVGGIKANMMAPANFLSENLIMGANILEAARQVDVRRFLNMGSSCMYPRLCDQPMKEEYLLTGLPEPTNEAYALAKIAITKLCQYYASQHGLPCLTLVAPNLYGIYETFDAERSHVISALLMKFHAAKQRGDSTITLWGTGTARREFLFAADMAKAIVQFLEHPSWEAIEPPYINVGSDTDVSIKELAEQIKEIVGFKGYVTWDPSKPDGMPRKLMDSSRAKALGWRISTPLHEGITQTYSYFLSSVR